MVISPALCCSFLKVLISLCMLQLFICLANGQSFYCPNTATYNKNSTYQANLRRLLSDLSSDKAANNLFLSATVGYDVPDIAYGMALCRGDLSIDQCRECLQKATTEIVEPQRCPKEKNAVVWYDECMLRYSNQSFSGHLDLFITIKMSTPTYISNQTSFDQALGNAMDEAINRAAGIGEDGSLKGFARGESDFEPVSKLYNLVQCTPDLSGSQCKHCLLETLAMREFGKPGGRVIRPSCNIRYETYPFFQTPLSSPPDSSPPSTQVPPGPEGTGGLEPAVIVAIVVPITFSIILFTLCFYFLRARTWKKYNIMEDTDADVQYDLRFVKAATNNFSIDNKIGEGGFGKVFKGSLNNGQQIAVKRLSKSSGQGDQEFKNEVTIVAKLQHINLVRLLGYCLDKEEKILIFEYVPNKSLDFMLFDQGKRQSLDWSSRYKIICGAGRGILYLHEDSRLRIIHRDIKASNILLDNDLNAKISDFGLARIVGLDKSEGSTNRIVGTFGYMSPEYIMHGQFSTKSDVFSFGVLVLEIISGRRNNKFYQSSEHLLSHAWKLWRDGTPLDLLDPSLGDTFDKFEVIRCMHIGLLCVQNDLDERPTMASVVLMLNSSSMILPISRQPAFFVQEDNEIQDSNLSESFLPSSNGLSISDLYPR